MPNQELECPRCRYRDIYRMQRVGFLQITIYPLFGYYPWECSKCRKTYLLKGRRFQDQEPVEQGAR